MGDQQGLFEGLPGSWAGAGGQRRLQGVVVPAAREVGIPLARIAEALDTLPRDEAPSRGDWARLSSVWRDDLNRRIAELEGLRDRLSNCIGCGCLSLEVCELYNEGDRAARGGAGAQYLTRSPAKG